MKMTEQLTMFGPPVPADLGDLTPEQKAEYLLDENPDARGNDKLLMLLWWERFDALGSLFLWTMRDLLECEKSQEEMEAIADAALERFKTWFLSKSTTHPETIRRRRAALQSNRKKHGTLRGPAHITAYRKARDGAGPPRR